MDETKPADQFYDLWTRTEDGSGDFPPHSIYLLITAEVNQAGKTAFSLILATKILERLHGRKFTIENVHFETDDFIERRQALGEWDIQVLDEPQRAASNRRSYEVENQIMAEYLQTHNNEHKHALLPTPHSHFIDSAIANVCTSQAVITGTGHANFYTIRRGQLNRRIEQYTPAVGWVSFLSPVHEIPELWAAYTRKRSEYNTARAKEQIAQLRTIKTQSQELKSGLNVDDLVSLVVNSPDPYTGKAGRISPTLILREHSKKGMRIPYNRAVSAALEAERIIREEKEALQAEATV
jgi:hypothetical protein